MKTCECLLCKRNQQYYEALVRLPEQDKKFWEEVYSKLFHAESDRDYWKAKFEGTWPEDEPKWYKGPLTKKHIAELRRKLATARGVISNLIEEDHIFDQEELERVFEETADP